MKDDQVSKDTPQWCSLSFSIFSFFFPADEMYSVTIRSFRCSALGVLWHLYTTYIPGVESLNPIFGLPTWAGSR